MDIDRWINLMKVYNLGENKSEYQYILKKHSEQHRAYHNVTHIQDCLTKLYSLGEIEHKNDIELAFWYHDLIYNPYGKDNELKSAQQAVKFLKSKGLEQSIINKIETLIMATIHTEAPQNIEEAYIMDIDISILGSDEKEYENYTKKIRREYKLVPEFLYRKGRLKIMKMFLKRDQLYFTDHFRYIYEERARFNIRRELVEIV